MTATAHGTPTFHSLESALNREWEGGGWQAGVVHGLAHQFGHGGVASRDTIFTKRAQSSLLSAVLLLNLKFVLQEYEIALAF